MQDENRFFRWLWRLNAVLLALAGITLLVALGVNLIGTWTRQNPIDVPEGHFAPVPKSAEQDFTYRLVPQSESVALPHEQFFALQRWNGPPKIYGLAELSKPLYDSALYQYTNAVNLLAISTVTGESHWLFDGYRRAVFDQQSIYGAGSQIFEPGKPPPPAKAIVIRTVDQDTNGDGKFDYRDGWSLYYYRPSDAKAVKFFQAEYILSMREVEGGDFFVVYERGKSAITATFSVPDFKLKSEKQLPDVPQ